MLYTFLTTQADYYIQHTTTTDTVNGSDTPAGGTVLETETDAYHYDVDETLSQMISQGAFPSETMASTHKQTDDRTVTTALSGSPPPSGSTAGETITAVATQGGNDNATSNVTATGPGGTEYTNSKTSRSWTYGLVNGAVTQVDGPSTTELTLSGNDPFTGAVVSYGPADSSVTPPDSTPPGDWFKQLSNFAAGMADTVSGGLTQRIRKGLGYNDAVDTNSRAYGAGQVAGEVVNVAVQNLTPCRFVGMARNGVRALQGVQGTANLMDAGDAFQSGNVLQGMTSLANARASFGKMTTNCFAAGTPVGMEFGRKAIEEIREGEGLLAIDEHDSSGKVRVREVIRTFVRVAPIWELYVGKQVVRSTAEHPFFVEGKGWTALAEIRAGDRLRTGEGGWVRCDGVED